MSRKPKSGPTRPLAMSKKEVGLLLTLMRIIEGMRMNDGIANPDNWWVVPGDRRTTIELTDAVAYRDYLEELGYVVKTKDGSYEVNPHVPL